MGEALNSAEQPDLNEGCGSLDKDLFAHPLDDLVHLKDAFDQLGRYRFGRTLWSDDMARAVRLGTKNVEPEKMERAQWALTALIQCVQNGRLPLVYFVGTRRIGDFENHDGQALHALYPEPEDGEPGLIELADGGGIYPCMVHVGGFPEVLKRYYGPPSARRRGPKRGFADLDAKLDAYFVGHYIGTRTVDVYRDIKAENPDLDWPSPTVWKQRIKEARERADRAMGSKDNSDQTPTGR